MLVDVGAPKNIFGDLNRTSTCSIRWTIVILMDEAAIVLDTLEELSSDSSHLNDHNSITRSPRAVSDYNESEEVVESPSHSRPFSEHLSRHRRSKQTRPSAHQILRRLDQAVAVGEAC